MKSVSIALLACLVVISLKDVSVSAKEKSCQDVMGGLMKEQLGGISKCTKKLKFKTGKEKAKKMNCILRCVMGDVGILDENGQIKMDQIDMFMDKFFPAHLQDRAKKTFMPCLELSKEPFKSVEEDEFCLSYEPTFKCLMGSIPNLCVGA